MKKCPYCGRAVEDNATACNHCFAEITHEQKEEKSSEETDKHLRERRRR